MQWIQQTKVQGSFIPSSKDTSHIQFQTSTWKTITDLYVQNTLEQYSSSHDSFLQDTPDFLRWLEDLNDENIIEDDDILVTVDVTGFYTNIDHSEGIKAVREILEEYRDDNVKIFSFENC